MFDSPYDCQSWLDQLPHYVAGTLPAPERAALERHLALCADCRAAHSEWETLAAAVRVEAASRANRRTLPQLKGLYRNGQQPLSILGGAGRGGETDRTLHIKPGRKHAMTSSQMTYPVSLVRRRAPSITLAAALLLIVLFGSALLAINLPNANDSGLIPAGIAAATPTPEPSATPTPEAEALPDSVKLDGIHLEMQGWNNQGPANLAMALRYWGWQGDQDAAAAWLKPNPEDKSVAPWQMAYYTNTFTHSRAIYRMGGTEDALKRLLAAGFPVIVQQSIELPDLDWLGHYVLLVGYDEGDQQFLTYDSFLGSNRPQIYHRFDELWRHFNRTFIVIYDPAREDDLDDILGDYADPVYGAQHALELARAEVDENSSDAWAWFNLGTSYTALGQYSDAVTAYDQAFELELPWRLLWYQFGPYEAYFGVSEYNTVLTLAEDSLATTPFVEEAYYWQVMAYRALSTTRIAPGVDAFYSMLDYNPNFLLAWVDHFPPAAASDRLPVGWEVDAGVLFGERLGLQDPGYSPDAP